MKRKRFSETQIIKALKPHETGVKVSELCREMGVVEQTFYRWRAKYAGLEVSEAKRLKEIEAENGKLKKRVAELMIDRQVLKETLIKEVVKPVERKQIAKDLVKRGRRSERKARWLVGIRRCAYRYQSQRAEKDCKLKAQLLKYAQLYPSYGYLMLHGMLKRDGLVVNRKRTYRLYTQAKLQLRTKRRKKLYRSRRNPTPPSALNERWSMDFVHDQLGNGRRFRVLNGVDDYSRECIRQIAALFILTISSVCVARYLSQLIKTRRAKPKSIVCDNGTEFSSKAMFYWSRAQQVKLNFIQPGKATQNAFVESFNGKFRDSCLNQYWFRSLEDAKTTIENWRKDYNRVRPHSSLAYQPPSVFAEKSA